MSTAHRIRARNVRSGVLIVSDAAMLTLSDAQQDLIDDACAKKAVAELTRD
jgi:hypothetical protein